VGDKVVPVSLLRFSVPLHPVYKVLPVSDHYSMLGV
jgi:hypothetical protein